MRYKRKSARTMWKAIVCSAVLAALATACGSTASPGAGSSSSASGPAKASTSPLSIQIGWASISLSAWPLVATEYAGYFPRDNITVVNHLFGVDSASLAALQSGAIQMAVTTPETVLQADAAGAGVVIIAGVINEPVNYLIAGKNITSAKDLSGKKIAVSEIGGGDAYLFQALAAKVGITGYQFVTAGAQANRMAALQAGAVDAVVSDIAASTPFIQQGYKGLGPVSGYGVHLQWSVLAVERSWLSSHVADVKRFLTAYAAGAAWLHDPAHKTAAIQALVSNSAVTAQEAGLGYPLYVSGGGSTTNGCPDAAGIQAWFRPLKVNPSSALARNLTNTSYLPKCSSTK